MGSLAGRRGLHKPGRSSLEAELAGYTRVFGRNLFLYRHDRDANGAMTVDFGVEVTRSFEAADEVACVITPEGEAAGRHCIAALITRSGIVPCTRRSQRTAGAGGRS